MLSRRYKTDAQIKGISAPDTNHFTSWRISIRLLTLILFLLVTATSALSQECIRRVPIVKFGPAPQITPDGILPGRQETFAGNTLTYVVSVTNEDSPACPTSTFVVMPTFPEEGFTHSPVCIHFTLRPGETGSRPVVIKAPGQTCVGSKTIREVATNESVSGFSGFADADFNVVAIAPNCGRMAPTVTILPTEPSASPVDPLTYTVQVTNNDNPACGMSAFTINPTLGDGLISHTPNGFVLSLLPGQSDHRPVTLSATLFGPNTLVFTETATHIAPACLRGSATGRWHVINRPVAGTDICCGKQTSGTTDRYDDCVKSMPNTASNCQGKDIKLTCNNDPDPLNSGNSFSFFKCDTKQ